MKVLFFDLETSGLDPARHGIVQAAFMVEIDGLVKDDLHLLIRPDDMEIDPKALDINGHRLEELNAYGQSPETAKGMIEKFFGSWVNKYDPADKFYPCAYNGHFDLDFLVALWKRMRDPFLGSWLNWRLIDPLPVLRFLAYSGVISLSSFTLSDAAKLFDIPLVAHDAMQDLNALRGIVKKLEISLKGVSCVPEKNPV